MKKITVTSLALICLGMLTNCGGSGSANTSSPNPVVSEDGASLIAAGSGVKLDPDTELETGFQGLTVENILIVDGSDKKISTKEIALNTKFSIVYEGVKNYTLKNGKAFPGLSIQVLDNNQKTIISEANLLASYADGLSEQDASVLRATITVGDPMKPGKYICSIKVVDKNENSSSIMSNWSFEVK